VPSRESARAERRNSTPRKRGGPRGTLTAPEKKCGAEPGAFLPRIDRNSCEGKKDCVEVCPYDVFEVRRIDDHDFAGLSFLGKMKSRAHGRQTAYTPHADLCQACGLCVVACPEKAITLVANPSPPALHQAPHPAPRPR